MADCEQADSYRTPGRDSGCMDAILDHLDEGVLRVDDDWAVVDANDVAAALLDVANDDLVGSDVREAFPQSVDATFHEHFGGDAAHAAVEFEEFFPTLECWLGVRTVELDDALAVFLADVTERHHREQDLVGRQRELETLSRINDIVQDVIRALVGASGREDIEEAVVDRLTDTNLYDVAWIGERDPARDSLTRRVAAGDDTDIVDHLVASDDGSGPELDAVAEGETRVVGQVATDESMPEAVRAEAFKSGLQSGIAVPLSYGSTVFGVLGVYASRPDAFSTTERSGFETLGRVAGFAINAARHRNLLLADAVVEVEIQVTDTAATFVRVSHELGCTATVEGVVPLSEGTLLCYVNVEGADAAAFEAAIADTDAVTLNRIVDDRVDGCLLELSVTDDSPVLTLAERGASVPSATFDEGTGRIVAEVAPDEDLREVVESVSTQFDDSALLAKRERTRPVETEEGFRGELRGRLTDRQQTAIRTAYFASYFESPRGSTAEEVAESLGITSPTFHHHIRAGLRKLLDVYIDEGEDED
jgi:predicted DNA binding protein